MSHNLKTITVQHAGQEFSISAGDIYSIGGIFYKILVFDGLSCICEIMNPWYADDVPDAWNKRVPLKLEQVVLAAYHAKFDLKQEVQIETDSVFARFCKVNPSRHAT